MGKQCSDDVTAVSHAGSWNVKLCESMNISPFPLQEQQLTALIIVTVTYNLHNSLRAENSAKEGNCEALWVLQLLLGEREETPTLWCAHWASVLWGAVIFIYIYIYNAYYHIHYLTLSSYNTCGKMATLRLT
jgi:hypothetical protein